MNAIQPNTTYRWKGKNHFGEKLKGETMAKDVASLRLLLKEQGLISFQITPVYSLKAIFQIIFKKITHPDSKKSIQLDITQMIRQLNMLLSAHIPLMQALEVIGKNEKNLSKTMKAVMLDCQQQIRLGQTLSYAFSRHAQYFNPLFCRWIEAGERSGTLDILLEHWVLYQEKSETMRQKVKKALTYPIFIVITAIIIAMVLFIGVVPVFEKLFHQFGAELPEPTQYVMILSQFFQTIGLPLLIVFGVGLTIVWRIRHRVPALLHAWDKIILKMPLSGKIIREASIARLARALSMMLMAGFPLSEALLWSEKLMNNTLLMAAVRQLRSAVISGISLNQAMSASPFFPSLLKQMTAVGEMSGTLDKTLAQTADFYEKAVSNTVDNMSQLIEPVIMAVLGVLTGGFILAMYLPVFKLGSLF